MAIMILNPLTLRFAVLAVLAGGLLALSPMGGIARQAVDDPVTEAPAPEAESIGELAWVDPIITGPVSPAFKRLREQAGCDTATWPNIPDVCFPRQR
jgi:hypothetical protein